VNPAETSLRRTKQVSTEALLTWLPHPGTAIYLGYNNDVQNLDRTLCNRLMGGGCDPSKYGAAAVFELSAGWEADLPEGKLAAAVLRFVDGGTRSRAARGGFRIWGLTSSALAIFARCGARCRAEWR
jgi:hypothetical protein